jgi:hypothetical protein
VDREKLAGATRSYLTIKPAPVVADGIHCDISEILVSCSPRNLYRSVDNIV